MEAKNFAVLIFLLIKPAFIVFVAMYMHLVCCLDGAVSHKCIYMHIVFASTLCLWIILCLCVCMHGISLLPLMCSCVASSFCALVSSCSYSAHPSFCLSMLHFFFLLFSCCTALCYRCFQLVCAWHPAVYCPEPPFLHARPLPPPVYINRSLMLSGNRHASQLSPSTYELGHLDPHCLINAPEG